MHVLLAQYLEVPHRYLTIWLNSVMGNIIYPRFPDLNPLNAYRALEGPWATFFGNVSEFLRLRRPSNSLESVAIDSDVVPDGQVPCSGPSASEGSRLRYVQGPADREAAVCLARSGDAGIGPQEVSTWDMGVGSGQRSDDHAQDAR